MVPLILRYIVILYLITYRIELKFNVLSKTTIGMKVTADKI